MSTMTTHDDSAMRRTYVAVAVCGVVMGIGLTWGVGPKWGLSVTAGALVALGNLWLLSRAVRNLLAASGGRAASWSLMAVVKFFVLMGVTFLLVRSPRIEALGLAFGFCALPLGIVIGNFLQTPRPDEGIAAGRLNEDTDHA